MNGGTRRFDAKLAKLDVLTGGVDGVGVDELEMGTFSSSMARTSS